jgi:hypothetical protein
MRQVAFKFDDKCFVLSASISPADLQALKQHLARHLFVNVVKEIWEPLAQMAFFHYTSFIRS